MNKKTEVKTESMETLKKNDVKQTRLKLYDRQMILNYTIITKKK